MLLKRISVQELYKSCYNVEGRGKQFDCKVQLNSCPKAIYIYCFVILKYIYFGVEFIFKTGSIKMKNIIHINKPQKRSIKV